MRLLKNSVTLSVASQFYWVVLSVLIVLPVAGSVAGDKSATNAAVCKHRAARFLPPTAGDIAPREKFEKLTIASEGDSLSVFWGGNHTGVFARDRPSINFISFAYSGGSLRKLEQRKHAIAEVHADILTVFVGANDLHNYSSGNEFAERLADYAEFFRTTGTLVAVGTLLPRYDSKNPQYTVSFNQKRKEANDAIRAMNGKNIDAVIDFAADPAIGPDSAARDPNIYHDGLHPSNACGEGCGGQGHMAQIYISTIDEMISHFCAVTDD